MGFFNLGELNLNIMKIAALTSVMLSMTGCNTLNSALADKEETVEMYHIFDIKTAAKVDAVGKAVANGLSENTNSVQQNRPLIMNTSLPAKPGRFTINDLSNKLGKISGLGSILAMPGMAPLKTASCDGSVWNAHAIRRVTGSHDLNLYTCLYRYKDGYNLDIYAVFRKTDNIFSNAAGAMIGSSDEWVNKTIMDTVRAVHRETGAKVSYLEGQPEISNLPWVDKINN